MAFQQDKRAGSTESRWNLDNSLPYIAQRRIDVAFANKLTYEVQVTKEKFHTAGSEIRFDDNANEPGEGTMTKMMIKKHGLTLAQINDKAWLTTRWVTPPERNHAGVVERDFEFQYVSEVA